MSPRKPGAPTKTAAAKGAATSRRKATAAPGDNGMATFSMHTSDARSSGLVAAVREASEAHRARALTAAPPLAAVDQETVARQYLQQAIAGNATAKAKLKAATAAGARSEFKSLGTETLPLTGTKTVKFRQTLDSVPVYGSLVTVELDEDNRLVGMNSSVGEPVGVSPIAKVSAADAVAAVKTRPGPKKDVAGIVPRLHYWYDSAGAKWRLVFILEDVPVAAATTKDGKAMPRLMDYVVDAQSGRVVAELPRMASMAAETVSAADGLGKLRQFDVSVVGKKRLLKDAALNVQTFDFSFGDPAVNYDKLPGKAIGNPPKWTPAAVSAHANAAAVATFLRTVLKRNNIDNQGGPMNSSINCIDASEAEGQQQWRNAFWNGTQMVYGQILFDGKLLSISVDLDVVAHEMFHGVTDMTARLEYANQSGALNESYSDIFGVIVANFHEPDATQWNYRLGERLDTDGKPFRDMSDPASLGQPAHMKQFQKLPNTVNGDYGGVHINSGIHNKAAHLVLTAKDAQGAAALTPPEVAAIYYLALTQQLSRTSQFADSRRAVASSALTLFRKLPVEQQRVKLRAIDDAFDAVGIAGTRVQV